MTQTACTHDYQPCIMFHHLTKACFDCGQWWNISRGEFRRLFGYKMLRLHTEELKRVRDKIAL